nr:efflux RND transporter periplasmic adaptor subunit [Acidocella aromatica]
MPRSGREIAVAGLLGLAALAGCGKKQPPPPPPVQAGVITVHTQPVTRTTDLPGRTSSVMIAQVRPQVNGVILKRMFVEGSEVKAGQQLYQIDPAPYQATYDAAVAQLAHAEAALATDNAKAERYKPLAAAQAVSQQDYDDALAAALEAKADIATAKAAVESAQVNLRYTKVLSPITGTIGASSYTEGALVTDGQTDALATVTTLDPIYVDVNQPTATLLRLKQEMASGQLQTQGDGTATVKLQLEDGSTYPLTGKLEFSQVYADESTGTVMLRAIFANPQHLLLPGMYAHAELVEGVNTQGILVPQVAVSHNTHGDATVLVVDKDNKVSQRVIQTGPAIGQNWVVNGGLAPGDRVVVDNLLNVQPGMTITPVAEDLSAASGGGN